MATFSLDENISRRIVPLLHAAGHRTVTTREMRQERARDDEQLFLCWQNGWILVTHNGKDFSLIHDALHRWANTWGMMSIHAGILVTRDGMSEREEARALDIFAASGLTATSTMYEWRSIGSWVSR